MGFQTCAANHPATGRLARRPLQNPLFRFLLYRGGAGFRERLLGDGLFLSKLGIELGVGICTKV